ncbi:type II toxin-antitoxin system prevent-host-death family antitoxin [Cellulomonas endometrii]|uniref:type II toxin-antitoxin system prevent-host-death family antitoxin n=1 Tax=Cellulomonas endometrii TaxID=3036301 RepID=UPI0024ACFFEA|nr:type II toxin-antitoxin system prevent-host-death family antitoxin [Cellulomonas endometrii]
MSTLTREVTARELRAHLGSLVNEAAYGRGRIGLHRYGSLVAVLIGVDDFMRLQRLEAEPGALHAEESLDEWAARVIAEGRASREADEEARRAADQEAPGAADAVAGDAVAGYAADGYAAAGYAADQDATPAEDEG